MTRPLSSFSALALSSLVATFAVAACQTPLTEAPTLDDAGVVVPDDDAPSRDAGKKKDAGPRSPDEADVPEVVSIDPSSAPVGSVGPSVLVSGKNFVERSVVQLDGAPLATSFVSDTELRATIPSGKLATVGVLRISVGTAPPGGGASKEIEFQVVNPKPQLKALSPLSVVAGSGASALEVTGAAFVDGAQIVFGATALATTFVSSTQLSATIPSALLTSSGSVPVTVTNPTPGGGASTDISFTISNPSASISSIAPSSATINGAAFTLTVNGTGFLGGSIVRFNGDALSTTYASSSKLTAQVPASALTTAGDFPIVVQNQPPGGGVSAPVVLRVQYPVPTVSSVTPSTVTVGAGATTITVSGTGFSPTSQLTFDGAAAATTFISGTQLKTTIDASELAIAGTHQVRVFNPSPGGGTSPAAAFAVNNPAPTIASLSPAAVTVGAPDAVITITGAGFVAASTVKANNIPVASTYVSATQLTATVPSNSFLSPGNVAITVTTPAPGGGTSSARNLVVGCDTTGVQYPLAAIGTTTTITPVWDATGLMSTWTAGGACNTVTVNPAQQQPGRYYVVQNTTGQTIQLSAWADCTTVTNGDAFLTFYRRPAPPTNDNERYTCAFVVAEGRDGSVPGYESPESNGSAYCPGLTKANGGGLQLAACEKAVVHIQSGNYTPTFPPPKKLKIKAEAP